MPDKLPVHFGKNLRRIRREAGYTIKSLAAQIGIQPGPLGNIERGLHAPSSPVLYALSRALKVPLDQFFLSPEGGEEWQEGVRVVDLDGREFPEPLVVTTTKLVRAVHVLEDFCGAHKHCEVPLTVHLELTDEGMEQLAARMRQYMGVATAVVFDYFELFEIRGFRVVCLPMEEGNSSVCYDDPKYNKCLLLYPPG